MSTKKRLDLTKELNRSGEKYIKVFREQLEKRRQKGLGYNGKPKSDFNSVGNTIASGNLYKKASYQVVDLGGGNYDLLFSFPDYIKYLEKGIKGKGDVLTKRKNSGGGKSPFVESLLKWINKKGLKVQGTSKLGLALAIRTNIFKYGIAPTKLLEETTNIYLERYAKSIAKGYLEEIEDIFFTTLTKK
jgi:hypothetical protein